MHFNTPLQACAHTQDIFGIMTLHPILQLLRRLYVSYITFVKMTHITHKTIKKETLSGLQCNVVLRNARIT